MLLDQFRNLLSQLRDFYVAPSQVTILKQQLELAKQDAEFRVAKAEEGKAEAEARAQAAEARTEQALETCRVKDQQLHEKDEVHRHEQDAKDERLRRCEETVKQLRQQLDEHEAVSNALDDATVQILMGVVSRETYTNANTLVAELKMTKQDVESRLSRLKGLEFVKVFYFSPEDRGYHATDKGSQWLFRHGHLA